MKDGKLAFILEFKVKRETERLLEEKEGHALAQINEKRRAMNGKLTAKGILQEMIRRMRIYA